MNTHSTINEPRLREILSECRSYGAMRQNDRGELVWDEKRPPKDLAAAIMSRSYWPGVPELLAIARHPVYLGGGRVLNTTGYDSASRIYLYQPCPGVVVPERPTVEDLARAVAVLLDILVDFPCEKPAHRTAAIAIMLTILARYAINGPTPGFLIDANMPGSGKGLLAYVLISAILGVIPDLATMPGEDAELRKFITAKLRASDNLFLFDNIGSRLGSASLDALLTARHWEDRILGASEIARLPFLATVVFTGNNLTLIGDINRRIIPIRLMSASEQPECRTGFQHPEILAYVAERRAAVISACCTILRAHACAGSPRHGLKPMGSFEAWSLVVREALVFAGLGDPGEARTDIDLYREDSGDVLRQLIAAWPLALNTLRSCDGSGGGADGRLRGVAIEAQRRSFVGLTAREASVFAATVPHHPLTAALHQLHSGGGDLTSNRIGAYFRSLRDRVSGQQQFRVRTIGKDNVWFVAEVAAGSPITGTT